MAEYLKVNTLRLGSDADLIRREAGDLLRRLDALDGQVSRLDAMWDAQDGEVSKARFHQGIAELRDLIGAFEKVSEHERTARRAYESGERKVNAIIAELRV